MRILAEYKDKKVLILIACALFFNWLVKMLNKTFLPSLEQRHGAVISDPVLDLLPAMDISWPIFIVFYGVLFLGLVILYRKPKDCITQILSFTTMYLIRFVCILLIPIEPPSELVVLKDPIVETLVLHKTFLTKDLFFSGHFACVFLLFLMMKERKWKIFYLIACVVVGTMLMIQHIHYSYDILGAIPFCYISYFIASGIVNYIFQSDKEEVLDSESESLSPNA